MQSPRFLLFRFAMFGVLVAAFLLAGCGRKGPLDLPPSDSAQPPAQSQSGLAPGATAAPASRSSPPILYDAEGRPLAPKGPAKKLPGDVLID